MDGNNEQRRFELEKGGLNIAGLYTETIHHLYDIYPMYHRMTTVALY